MRWNLSLAALLTAATAGSSAQAPRLELLWRVPAGTGLSAVAAADSDLYLVESDGEADHLVARDAASGAPRWRAILGPTHAEASLGPRGRPVVAGPVVIAVGSSCHVVGARRDTGAIAWDIDLGARFKSRFPSRQACAQSALVSGSRAIFVTGAPDTDRVVAVDVTTGTLAWSATGVERTMMTTPVLQTPDVALVHTVSDKGTSGLAAIDVATGRLRWQMTASQGLSEEVPLPVGETRMLLQSWSDSRLIEASSGAPSREVWTSGLLTANGTPPVIHGTTIFGFGGNHGDSLLAIDAVDGSLRWQQRVLRGSIARDGDRLVVLSETSGLMRLVRVDADAYREVARLAVLTPGAPAPGPAAISGDTIYVRSAEEVAAVRVR